MGLLDGRAQMSAVPQTFGERVLGLLGIPLEAIGDWAEAKQDPVEGWNAPFDVLGNAPFWLLQQVTQPAGVALREGSEGLPFTDPAGVFQADSPLSFLNQRLNQRFSDATGAVDAYGLMGGVARGLARRGPDIARGILEMEAQRAADPTLGLASRVVGARPAGSVAIAKPDFKQAPKDLMPKMPDQPWNTGPVSAPPGIAVTATHWSDQPGLDAILAGQRGSRGPWGGESNRLTGPVGEEVGPRSYWYLGKAGDVPRERGVGSHPYTVDLPGIYDLQRDPDHLFQGALDTVRRQYAQREAFLREQGEFPVTVTEPMIRQEASTLFEQLVRDTGYRGILDSAAPQGPVVTMLEDVDLTGKLDTMAMRQAVDAAQGRTGLLEIAHMGEADNVGSAMGGKMRRWSTGQYPGSPGKMKTPQALSALTRRLKQMAREGEPGMEWYERDTQNLAQLSSGDIASAYPLATAVSVTSPQQAVAGNAMEGLRAGYQNVLGEPFAAGRFGDDMGETLERTMSDPVAGLGRKRASFRGNLLKWWDDVRQGTTEDMQMARAAGFGGDSLGAAQYDFLERTVARIADQLNAERKLPTDKFWTPERVQAAIWTAQKSRRESRSATETGANLADAMADANAHVPWEARSNKVPALASGKGPANTLYYNDIQHLLTDRFGNNAVARGLGAYQTPQYRGQGIWGAERNQNSVMQIPVPLARGPDVNDELVARGYGWLRPLEKDGRVIGSEFVFHPGATRAQRYIAARMRSRVDPSARKVLDATAVEQAKVLGQEAGAWARFTEGGPKYAHNAVRVEMPDFRRQDLVLLNDEIERVKKSRKLDDFLLVVQPTKSGVEVYRPLLEDLTEEGAELAMHNDEIARDIIQEALTGPKLAKGRGKKKAPADAGAKRSRGVLYEYQRRGYGEPKTTWGQMDSAYYQDDWGDFARINESMPESLRKDADATSGLLEQAIKAHQDWVNRRYPPR